jgi:predicted transposase YbfD/YdcC
MPRNPNKIDYSGGLPEHFACFEVIEDPRSGGNKKHHFGEVLFMAVSAMLCGMNGFADIEEFCHLQAGWLKKWIKLPNGIPRAQTFSNIFQIIDPKLFNKCVADHIGTLSRGLQRQIVAVDGKCLRGSHGLKESCAHAVSAWAADSGVTLAQDFVGEKTNEIDAIPKLLEMLSLEGHIVTIDAMGTHTHIAEAIIAQQADYILALKGNQGNLHKEVVDQFHFATAQLDLAKCPRWSSHSDTEKAHGRITTRRVVSTSNLDWMDGEIRERWKGLRSVVMVQSETTDLGEEKTKHHTRYYISSLECGAEEFQRHIRLHWSIENQCHWVLDTAFREDHNQTCQAHAAKNLGAMRRIVLNLLKIDESLKKSIPKKRLHALMRPAYREKLLSLA